MNAFNRLIILILALLLLAVPVLLLLITFGVVPADLIDQYTGYRGAVQALGNLSTSSLTSQGRRIVIAIVGALVALIALLLLLRELTLGRRVSRSTVMDGTPGRETVITANAVKTLAESAAREVGARVPLRLAHLRQRSRTSCPREYRSPTSDNYTELAARARENIRRVLGDQGVPVKDVEVTVRGTAS